MTGLKDGRALLLLVEPLDDSGVPVGRRQRDLLLPSQQIERLLHIALDPRRDLLRGLVRGGDAVVEGGRLRHVLVALVAQPLALVLQLLQLPAGTTNTHL